MLTRCILPTRVSILEYQEQAATSYSLYSGFISMQGTHECMIQHMQTMKVNGENLQHWQGECMCPSLSEVTLETWMQLRARRE